MKHVRNMSRYSVRKPAAGWKLFYTACIICMTICLLGIRYGCMVGEKSSRAFSGSWFSSLKSRFLPRKSKDKEEPQCDLQEVKVPSQPIVGSSSAAKERRLRFRRHHSGRGNNPLLVILSPAALMIPLWGIEVSCSGWFYSQEYRDGFCAMCWGPPSMGWLQ